MYISAYSPINGTRILDISQFVHIFMKITVTVNDITQTGRCEGGGGSRLGWKVGDRGQGGGI